MSWSNVSIVNSLLKSISKLDVAVPAPFESASNVGLVLNSAALIVAYCFCTSEILAVASELIRLSSIITLRVVPPLSKRPVTSGANWLT